MPTRAQSLGCLSEESAKEVRRVIVPKDNVPIIVRLDLRSSGHPGRVEDDQVEGALVLQLPKEVALHQRDSLHAPSPQLCLDGEDSVGADVGGSDREVWEHAAQDEGDHLLFASSKLKLVHGFSEGMPRRSVSTQVLSARHRTQCPDPRRARSWRA